jgi:hypothetical protein
MGDDADRLLPKTFIYQNIPPDGQITSGLRKMCQAKNQTG